MGHLDGLLCEHPVQVFYLFFICDVCLSVGSRSSLLGSSVGGVLCVCLLPLCSLLVLFHKHKFLMFMKSSLFFSLTDISCPI